MYNQKVERVFDALKWENNPENIKKFEKLMAELPDESRRVIEVRWGLIGDSKAYQTYEALDKALGIENSKEVYNKAIKRLKETGKYAILLWDKNNFPWEFAVSLGRLSVALLGEYPKEESVFGQGLINAIQTLTLKQSYIITRRFGLDSHNDYKKVTLGEVGKGYNVGKETIRQIEVKAIRKLKHPNLIREFYIPAKEAFDKFKAEENYSPSIDVLDFSPRVYNCLKRSGVNTVEDFKKLTSEKILRLRSVGKKGYEEVVSKREEIGEPLKKQ